MNDLKGCSWIAHIIVSLIVAATVYLGSCMILLEICSLVTTEAGNCKQRNTWHWAGTQYVYKPGLIQKGPIVWDTPIQEWLSKEAHSPTLIDSWHFQSFLDKNRKSVLKYSYGSIQAALTTNPISGVFHGALIALPSPNLSGCDEEHTGWLSGSQMWRKAWDKGIIDGHKWLVPLF